MIENATLLVYLWSIWDGIKIMLNNLSAVLIAFSGVICFGWMFILMTTDELNYDKEEQKKKKRERFEWYKKMNLKFFKISIPLFVIVQIVNTMLPSKESLLLIVSASPVAKTIQESYKDGKIKKINDLTDLALDKALKKLGE